MVNSAKIQLNALIGIPLGDRGPAYTFYQLLKEMNGGLVSAHLFAPIVQLESSSLVLPVSSGNSSILSKLPYRFVRSRAVAKIEAKFADICAASPGVPIAYLWSELSLQLARELADQRNTFVVREKINCGKGMARRIIERAYASLDAAAHVPDALSDLRIEKENAELHLADAIFCPSPMVRESLLEIGIPPNRLLNTSYGFDPDRLRGTNHALKPIDGLTLLFVGTLCVRKGAHILLESWERAGVKGRLVFVGTVEPLIAERYSHILGRPDVELHGFQRDVGAFFRSADYFIFPTLEEGGPQVTYEAGSCGLPSITTEMGAGAFMRHDCEGLIIDPDRRDDWVDAIRAIAARTVDRDRHSLRSRDRAQQFSWNVVGPQRRKLLLDALAAR